MPVLKPRQAPPFHTPPPPPPLGVRPSAPSACALQSLSRYAARTRALSVLHPALPRCRADVVALSLPPSRTRSAARAAAAGRAMIAAGRALAVHAARSASWRPGVTWPQLRPACLSAARLRVACASADASPKRAARLKKPGAQPGGAATKRSADDGASSVRKKAPAAPAGAELQLSAEQRRVLALVERGENVFITGSAGVGKSFTLNQVIATLKRRYGGVRRPIYTLSARACGC
jgi:hypothetical protein